MPKFPGTWFKIIPSGLAEASTRARQARRIMRELVFPACATTQLCGTCSRISKVSLTALTGAESMTIRSNLDDISFSSAPNCGLDSSSAGWEASRPLGMTDKPSTSAG